MEKATRTFEHKVGPTTLYVEYDAEGEFIIRLTDSIDGPDVYDTGLLSTTLEDALFNEVNRRCS